MTFRDVKTSDPDTLLRMIQVAFACSQSAWDRRDWQAHQRAAELHRKYTHLWRQAIARLGQATRTTA